MKTKRKRPPLEIGWREWVYLPDLCEFPIKAKIDTGAKTSAIHAFNVRLGAPGESASSVRFDLHPVQRRSSPTVRCETGVKELRRIRSSNGAVQTRPVVRTTLVLGERSIPIDLSLTNRDEMGFRLLIGRDALKRGVVIYPSRSFLLGKPGQEGKS